MTTGSDDALDVALGLLRAPALRGTLRARPLPDGMGELLAIASGSPERARVAAARTGHAQGELLEAARFYVQQVLLAEDADAYRVLGVQRDATHAEIRDHHRHLLRWLHPDRSEGAHWESAFATRVNQAWNQLRLQSARSDYDASLGAPDGPGATAAAVRSRRDAAMVARPRNQIAGPLTVLLLTLLCVVLAWFAVHREDNFEDPFGTAPAAPRRTAPDIATQMITSLPHRLDEVEVIAAEQRPAAAPATTAAPASAATSMAVSAHMSSSAPAAPAAATAMAATTYAPTPEASSRHPATRERQAASVDASREKPTPTEARALAAMDVTQAASQEDPLRLFSEAEDALRGIRIYLAGQDGVQPAWLDMNTGLEGAGIRAQLRARHAGDARLRMAVDAPGWTLDTHVATMLGAYRVSDRRGIVETGLLRVELARNDGVWRVARLHLEPAR